MKSELYRPQNSVFVASKDHREIQGERVPSSPPFGNKSAKLFSEASVSPQRTDSFRTDVNNLIQISSEHGRSFGIKLGSSTHIFFSDEYGNIFSTLNSKGNNLNAVEVRKTTETESGFHTIGLHESDSMVRILRASSILRRANVDTEIIVKVLEPTEFPFNGEMVSIPEFKKRLVRGIWTKESDSIGDNGVTKKDIPDLSRYFDNSTYFVTVRGAQVLERLVDIKHCQTKEELVALMEQVFTFVNKRQELTSESRKYNPAETEDLLEYFADYLPAKVGKNIAKIHGLGLIHGCPIPHNINLAGGLVDLDSVTGPALNLGDRPHSAKDLLDEVEQTRAMISNPDILEKLQKLLEINKESCAQRIAGNFLRAYLVENANIIEEKYGLDVSRTDSPETILRSLDEADNWNIKRVLKTAAKDEGDPIRQQIRAFAASSKGLFKDPFLERTNNCPLSELIPQGFSEFQTERSLIYLEDVYGDQIQKLESELGRDQAEALRAAYLVNRTLSQNATMIDEWETIEKQLLEKWIRENSFVKKNPNIGAALAKTLHDPSLEIKGLIKSGEIFLCMNRTGVDDFMKIANSLNGSGKPIHAFTAYNEGIFAYMGNRNNERPIMVFTDGEFNDFDTQPAIEIVGNPLAFFGGGPPPPTGCNIVEGATYMGTIFIDKNSGGTKISLTTLQTESDFWSQLDSDTKDKTNIEFFD